MKHSLGEGVKTFSTITCETGGSCRSSCSFSTSFGKSAASKMTVSFVIRFPEGLFPQWMAFNTPTAAVVAWLAALNGVLVAATAAPRPPTHPGQAN